MEYIYNEKREREMLTKDALGVKKLEDEGDSERDRERKRRMENGGYLHIYKLQLSF